MSLSYQYKKSLAQKWSSCESMVTCYDSILTCLCCDNGGCGINWYEMRLFTLHIWGLCKAKWLARYRDLWLIVQRCKWYHLDITMEIFGLYLSINNNVNLAFCFYFEISTKMTISLRILYLSANFAFVQMRTVWTPALRIRRSNKYRMEAWECGILLLHELQTQYRGMLSVICS